MLSPSHGQTCCDRWLYGTSPSPQSGTPSYLILLVIHESSSCLARTLCLAPNQGGVRLSSRLHITAPLHVAPLDDRPWCSWSDLRRSIAMCTLMGGDGSWLLPRQHLRRIVEQPEAYHMCRDGRHKAQIMRGKRCSDSNVITIEAAVITSDAVCRCCSI